MRIDFRVAEHHEMNELMEDLDETDMSSSGWLATANKLDEKDQQLRS